MQLTLATHATARRLRRGDQDTSRTEPNNIERDANQVSYVQDGKERIPSSSTKPFTSHWDRRAPLSNVKEVAGASTGGREVTAAPVQYATSSDLIIPVKAYKAFLDNLTAMAAQEAGRATQSPRTDDSNQTCCTAPCSKDTVCATKTSDVLQEPKTAEEAHASSGCKEEENPTTEVRNMLLLKANLMVDPLRTYLAEVTT